MPNINPAYRFRADEKPVRLCPHSGLRPELAAFFALSHRPDDAVADLLVPAERRFRQ